MAECVYPVVFLFLLLFFIGFAQVIFNDGVSRRLNGLEECIDLMLERIKELERELGEE